MLLKVGQLAKQTHLSVRTLHHYDEIGLLSPSVRTPAGHRLYNTKDIAVLYRIQALKQLGLSLQQVAQLIQENTQSLPDIITQQIVNLNHEIEQAEQLKTKLLKLQQYFRQGDEPTTSHWLDTLILMNSYEKYFTADEIFQLEMYAHQVKYEIEHEWPAMVNQLQSFVQQKTPAHSAESKNFVIRWTEMFERLTGNNPNLLIKLHSMSHNEIDMQIHRGISPAMIEYLGEAMGAVHHDIYAKYLTAEQMLLLNKNRQKNIAQWPPLIAAVRQQMQLGSSPESNEVQPLAAQWQQLFEDSVSGGDVEITARLRIAYQQEPLLSQGTGLDQALFTFIRQAIDHWQYSLDPYVA